MSQTQRTDLYAAGNGTPVAAPRPSEGVHAGTTQTTLTRSLRAPGAARRFVEASICGEHACQCLSAVRLAASEFATQAALIGEGPLTIGLNCDLTDVTVWVVFPTSIPVFGAPLALADGAAAWVIEGISRDWGTECLRDAERLWCTIPTGYTNLPAEGRADLETPARDSRTWGSAGPGAYDLMTERVDELTKATNDAQIETGLTDINHLLASLPEGRARMYALVMWLGLVDPT